MSFLTRNVITLHIALLVCAFAWLYGGMVGSALLPVIPWLWAFVLEAMLCFPQRRDYETSYDARERVWRDLAHDPLTWASAALMLVLLVPFVNVGLCPICDYPKILLGADPKPPVPFAPFCVNRLEHLNVVMWFVPALTAMLAVKHALNKEGKRTLLAIVMWNGVGLGLLGMIQQIFEAPGPLWHDIRPTYYFSTFGYPNMGGDYFTTLFGLAVGLWRWDVAEVSEEGLESREGVQKTRGEFWRKHHKLIPAVAFFFCAINTLSRAAILLVSALAIVFFLHAFVSFFSKMPRAQRVKSGALSLLVLVAIATCMVAFMPENVQKEVDTLNTDAILTRVTSKGQYHARVSVEVWKDNPLFGCGGWGYKHFCIPKMTDAELANIQAIGGINVHNDYLQLLAEHGLVGFALIVAIVIMLVAPIGPVWKAMVNSIRFLPPKQQPARPVQLFILPAPVFCILATAVASFIHGFADCPFRSGAVLILFFVSLAAVDGFLPRLRRHHDD